MTSRVSPSLLAVLLVASALLASMSFMVVPVVHAVATVDTFTPNFGSPPVGATPYTTDRMGTLVTVIGNAFPSTDTSCTVTSTPTAPPIGLFVDTTGLGCYTNYGGTAGKVQAQFRVAVGSTAASWTTVKITTYPSGTSATGTAFLVVPRIILSPNTGSGGTAVSVSGSGFTGGTATMDATSVTGTPVDSTTVSCGEGPDGTAGCNFQVKTPGTPPSGSYLIFVKEASGGTQQAWAPFAIGGGPILTLSSFGSPTLLTVTVSLWGTSKYNTLDTYVDFTTPATSRPDGSNPLWGIPNPFRCTASAGSITGICQFTVRADALGGTYTIRGTGEFADYSDVQFIVLSSFLLTPKTGGIGTNVALSGSGYRGPITDCTPSGTDGITTFPSSPVLLDWTGGGSCSVDSNGLLTGLVKIASTAAVGLSYSVRFTDSQVVAIAGWVSDTFSVTGPSIALSPSTGSGGDTIHITGSGFSSSDTSCTISGPANTIEGSPSCSVAGGSVTGSFVIKTSGRSSGILAPPNGIQVLGNMGDSAQTTLTIIPKITVTPNPARVGSSLTFTGSNFAAAGGCAFTVTLGLASDMTLGACTINSGFTLSVGSSQLKDIAGSLSYVLTVAGDSPVDGLLNSASTTLNVIPHVVTLNPTSGPRGVTVSVTGSGFALDDQSCSIVGSDVVETSPAPTCTILGGSVTGSFKIDDLATLGDKTVKVVGHTQTNPSGAPDNDFGTAIFTVGATISLVPISGPAGTPVLISGSNFADSGDNGPCAITSTPSGLISSPLCIITGGALSGSFTVASGAHDPYTVTVTGTTGTKGTATFTAPPRPTLTLDPTSGAAGQLVQASGSDYMGTTCTLTSSPSGLFTSSSCALAAGELTGASFTVSSGASPGSSYTVTVTTNMGASDSASATFTATSGTVGALTLTPMSGPPGTVVSGSATGFSSDVACMLTSSPSGLLSSPSCTIMGGGNINVGFTVSSTAGLGSYTVLAVGNTGKSASGSFTVTAVTTTTTGASFTVSVTPSSLTLNPGGVGTVTVTVQSLGSFNSPVALSVPTVPSGVTVGFTPNPVTPPAGLVTSSVLSIVASNSAPASTTIIAVSGTGGGLTASASVSLIVTTTTSTSTASTTITASTITTTGPWVPPKCIIATATFGSEASPAVQFLRNFRDHLVLGTKAGSAFMEVFNAWYYSFSPSVAKIIAANDPLRAPIRVILYPLLGVLGISTLTYSIFSGTPEFAAVMAGLVASSLIGLVYLTPFAFVGMRALTRRRRINVTNVAEGSLLLLAAALALLAAGELAGSFLMLAVASSAIVLICLIAAPAIAALSMLRAKAE